jgi:hypothetical protein
MAEERNDPRWSPDNDDGWNVFFVRQRANRITTYDGPPSNYHIVGRWRWWSAPGRTVEWVLQYIADENNRRCRCHHTAPRTREMYLPYNTPSTWFLATVMDEPVEAVPSRSRRHSSSRNDLVIHEPSPPR